MTTYPWFLELLSEAVQAINDLYRSDFQAFLSRAELEPMDSYLVQIALSAEPEPITPILLRQRTPYTAARTFSEQLSAAAEQGLFTAVTPDEYRLTEKGRHIAEGVARLVARVGQELAPLPDQDSRRLVELLRRVVEASLAAPEPPSKVAIRRSRFFEPGPDAAPFEHIRRHLGDMWAFRDDAHLASWRHHDVSGHGWEAFTFVWRGEADTAAALAEQLSPRGHNERAYAAALRVLVERGWLVQDDDSYRVTEKGQRLRQEAEEATDRFFYGPWQCLSESELAELRALMERLRDGLHQANERNVS